uniref:Uncharacterized protein n=1 Tax=Trichuris muris TaxID=70415 RepID=A0A5S6PYQ6_TRIMR
MAEIEAFEEETSAYAVIVRASTNWARLVVRACPATIRVEPRRRIQAVAIQLQVGGPTAAQMDARSLFARSPQKTGIRSM